MTMPFDPTSIGTTHCDPPEEFCSFVKEWVDSEGFKWQHINYDFPEALGFRDIEGAVIACVTHRLLAPSWAYEIDTPKKMLERTEQERR